jgi:phosphohistidine phosphatase
MSDFLQLWLGRHGEADDPDTAPTDFDRKLTPFGRNQVAQLTRWLLAREEAPELILHSPLVRARQTAEVIAGEISGGVVVMKESLLAPGFSTVALLHRLKNAGVQRVVCIGHQPDIGRSLAEMTGGVRTAIAPGTLACIEFQGATAVDTGMLRWLADPSWFAG